MDVSCRPKRSSSSPRINTVLRRTTRRTAPGPPSSNSSSGSIPSLKTLNCNRNSEELEYSRPCTAPGLFNVNNFEDFGNKIILGSRHSRHGTFVQIKPPKAIQLKHWKRQKAIQRQFKNSARSSDTYVIESDPDFSSTPPPSLTREERFQISESLTRDNDLDHFTSENEGLISIKPPEFNSSWADITSSKTFTFENHVVYEESPIYRDTTFQLNQEPQNIGGALGDVLIRSSNSKSNECFIRTQQYIETEGKMHSSKKGLKLVKRFQSAFRGSLTILNLNASHNLGKNKPRSKKIRKSFPKRFRAAVSSLFRKKPVEANLFNDNEFWANN